MSVQAHDMSRFWRIFTIQHGRINGTFTVKAGKERVHNVTAEEVTVYADDAHSWGRSITARDFTAFIRDDGSVDIPKHMIREEVRFDIEDAMDDLLTCIRACVDAFPLTAPSDPKEEQK